MGITIRGEYDDKGFFHLEHYFPYLIGKKSGGYQEVSIFKRVDTDAYTGMCDDLRFGSSIIFYLQNSVDYLSSKEESGKEMPLTLSGLSTSGKILLPILRTAEHVRAQAADSEQHVSLLQAAREGDENADVYSIVETSFIPFGSESDNYTILGIIKEVIPHTNTLTGEKSTEMLLDCNGLDFYVAINDEDLLGEPQIGRRFRGQVWLQGKVEFGKNKV